MSNLKKVTITVSPMNAVNMSQYQAFSEHFTAIQSAIKASVCDVADKCSERGITAKPVHQSVVHIEARLLTNKLGSF